MMQSAVALAASQQATKTLAEAKADKKQLGGDDDDAVRRLTGR